MDSKSNTRSQGEATITLFDLAFSHWLYPQITNSDKRLKTLLPLVKENGLKNEEERIELLEWLNDWGCRHISKKSHNAFSKEIETWWQNNINVFRKTNGEDDSSVFKAFDSLASIQVPEKGRTIHIGPVATAKAFFIIDPKKFVPWDTEIRKKYQLDESGSDYCKFLNIAAGMIKEVKREFKKENEDWIKLFPGYISDYKLIDEYLWITITNNIEICKEEVLEICNL
jgi:hypothetical protein